MKKLLILPLLLALICLGIHTGAQAQIQFDRNDDVEYEFNFGGEEEEEGPKVINPFADKYKADLTAQKTEGTSLLPNFIYYFTFLRKPGAAPDDLNLYIFSPGTVTGCLSKEQAGLETVKIAPALQIKITEGQTSVDTETVRYFHYECKPETGMVEMQITLSKEQLAKDKINKLVLYSEAVGPFNDIMLDMQDDRINVESRLCDLSRFGLPTKGIPTTFTYWLYPENTMVLQTSSADSRDQKIRSEVLALARRRGLTPLEEIIPGFEKEHLNDNKLFVVDRAGRYKEELADPRNTFTLGQIQQSEMYFGAKGPYNKTVEIPVYARAPGIHE
ncbi:MAG: hypothetical protein H6861_06640 [Rhodospirillales bacterium]|nr:hypothetical protein [Rhodospirillales bacterium]